MFRKVVAILVGTMLRIVRGVCEANALPFKHSH